MKNESAKKIAKKSQKNQEKTMKKKGTKIDAAKRYREANCVSVFVFRFRFSILVEIRFVWVVSDFVFF